MQQCYIYLLQLFTNLFSFYFQTNDNGTHAYAHSWFPNGGNRNQQNNISVFILNSNPIHWYNIFSIGKCILRGWKKSTKQLHVQPVSFITWVFQFMHNFSLVASIYFLVIEDFVQTNVFAWICTFCLIDNWLDELVYDDS